jgi:hypothetical protein
VSGKHGEVQVPATRAMAAAASAAGWRPVFPGAGIVPDDFVVSREESMSSLVLFSTPPIWIPGINYMEKGAKGEVEGTELDPAPACIPADLTGEGLSSPWPAAAVPTGGAEGTALEPAPECTSIDFTEEVLSSVLSDLWSQLLNTPVASPSEPDIITADVAHTLDLWVNH